MELETFFEQYVEISDRIETRFNQYTKICDKSQYGSLTSWIYSDGEIEIHWDAYWRYGGHDGGTFYMKPAWLEMSEEEWQAFLDKLDRKQKAKKKREETAERKRMEKEDKAKYEELKRKFGKEK
jgi:hypothetical protein